MAAGRPNQGAKTGGARDQNKRNHGGRVTGPISALKKYARAGASMPDQPGIGNLRISQPGSGNSRNPQARSAAADQPAPLVQALQLCPEEVNSEFGTATAGSLAKSIGLDIYHLLKSISTSELKSLADQPEIATLKQVWWEQYLYSQGELTWRNNTAPTAHYHPHQICFYKNCSYRWKGGLM
jgi:hypothetical protein